MLEFLTPVSTAVGLTNHDIVVVAVLGVLAIIVAALGSERAYGTFYGAVIGIAIYVVLRTLLSPDLQTPETAKVFSPGISNFLIQSSGYLVFILAILTALSGSMKLGSEKKLVRGLESFFAAGLSFALLIAVGAGFMKKAYVFTADTAFTLLAEASWMTGLFAASKILTWIADHVQAIVLFSVLFAIYRAFFAEIVWALLSTLVKTAFKKK